MVKPPDPEKLCALVYDLLPPADEQEGFSTALTTLIHCLGWKINELMAHPDRTMPASVLRRATMELVVVQLAEVILSGQRGPQVNIHG